jgi:hypothetical protein
MKMRTFPMVAVLFLFSLGVQQAFAQVHHLSVRVAQRPANLPARQLAKFNELFQLSTGMGVLPPVDGGGVDEWPCFGGGSQADCSSIGPGGVVLGIPSYTWPFSPCDAATPTSTNCGQIFWFYEDDTGDTTDHLIVQIVAKQGSNMVLNTGPYDFGPNPFGGIPGAVIVISDDVAFGTLGQTGKGNGYCFDPQATKQKYTCSDPFPGLVTITVTTKVGPSKITSHFDVNLQ